MSGQNRIISYLLRRSVHVLPTLSFYFSFNNAKEPWDNEDVRLAINYAIDQPQLALLGYEGANYGIVAPFSAYGVRQYVPFCRTYSASTTATRLAMTSLTST